jgi:Short C-terminal domain
MEQISSPLGSTGKKFIRFALSIVGLLILRGILGALPMLKSASVIGDTLLSPLVILHVAVDTVILLVMLAFGLSLGQDIQTKAPKLSDIGRIITRATIVVVLIVAYKAYELPAACLFVDQTDLMALSKNNSAQGSYGDLMRMWGSILGQVNAAAIQNASGGALANYQKIALAVFREPPNYYAWIFLILIAIPVVSLIPLVTRNMDVFTELVSQAARTVEGTAHGSRSAAASGDDIIEKLTKLKALLDSGAISQEDFESQKRRILGLPIPDSKSPTEAEDLRKLKTLLDTGVLTQEEYETSKKRLLERI